MVAAVPEAPFAAEVGGGVDGGGGLAGEVWGGGLVLLGRWRERGWDLVLVSAL